MNIKTYYHTCIIFLSLLIVSCSITGPNYTYLSKEKIKRIKNIIVIIEAGKVSPEIISIGGIGNQVYYKAYSGNVGKHSALEGFIGLLIAEAVTQYKISKALGKNKGTITKYVNSYDATQIIFQGISESFSRNTKACNYIDFDKTEFFSKRNMVILDKPNQTNIDNILSIRYRYGIGVSEKYPPQPSIVAVVEIYNPKTGELLQKIEIKTDSISLYNSIDDLPSLEEYSMDNCALFKTDLLRVSKIMGAEIARLYTYY